MITSPSLGLLCSPQSPEELADCLAGALSSDWDRQAISSAAGPYGYDRLAGQISSIYRQVLKSGRS